MIVYKDTRTPRSSAPRWPSHLVGAANLCRRESPDGDLVAITDPIYLGPPPEGTAWHPLPDDWEFCSVGPLDPETLVRMHPACSFLMVRDAQGHPWRIPAVLDPEGQPALPMKLGVVGHDLVDGQQIPRWEHRPTSEQSAVLASARAARAEILAGRYAELSLSIACAWISVLLPLTYHVVSAMVSPLEILDNRLIGQGLMACAGFPPPQGD